MSKHIADKNELLSSSAHEKMSKQEHKLTDLRKFCVLLFFVSIFETTTKEGGKTSQDFFPLLSYFFLIFVISPRQFVMTMFRCRFFLFLFHFDTLSWWPSHLSSSVVWSVLVEKLKSKQNFVLMDKLIFRSDFISEIYIVKREKIERLLTVWFAAKNIVICLNLFLADSTQTNIQTCVGNQWRFRMFNKRQMSSFSNAPASLQALSLSFKSLKKLSSLATKTFCEGWWYEGTKKYIKIEPECCCCNIFSLSISHSCLVSPFSSPKITR